MQRRFAASRPTGRRRLAELQRQPVFAALLRLGGVDRNNVAGLKARCTYDLGLDTSFQTGPLVIGSTLYGTTEKETFAIDATTCQPKWRVREQTDDSFLKTNRGLAFLDGRVFRGLQDGQVVAYDAATGAKLWEVRIADPTRGESVPAVSPGDAALSCAASARPGSEAPGPRTMAGIGSTLKPARKLTEDP